MDSRIGRRRAAAQSDGSPGYRKRRQEILRAAATVFNDKGYGGANLADVAAELGADRASIYYYFASKQELFQHVVREGVQANIDLVEQLRAAALTPADKLARLISGLMLSYAEHHPYLYVYIQEDMARVADADTDWARETRDLNRRFTEAMVAIVQDGLDDGSLRPLASAKVLSAGLLGMVNWSHRWFDPKGPLTAAEVGEAYAAMALDGLCADGPAART